MSSLQSVPSQDAEQHQQCHDDHRPHPSGTLQQCSLDDDEEDLQQQCCQDDDPNLIILGRVDDTDRLSEVNAGEGETIEMTNKENVENKPVNDTAVQEESQVTTVQEESQTGASKPQERVFSQSVRPTATNIVTGKYYSSFCKNFLFA